MSKFLEYALKYADLGWSVIPLVKNTKMPAIKGWPDKASVDREQITKWWTENPEYNIGILTGQKSGLLLIDVDMKGGVNGSAALEYSGFPLDELMDHLQQNTPSGGWQFIVKMPNRAIGSTTGVLCEGVDIKADRGYFVVAPSHLEKVNGYEYKGDYEWLTDQSPFDAPVKDMPDMFLTRIVEIEEGKQRQNLNRDKFKMPDVVANHTRNITLLRRACQLRWNNVDIDIADQVLRQENKKKCEEPIEEHEITIILNSAYKYDEHRPDISWDVGKNGQKLKTYNNCVNFLETDPLLTGLYKYNSFSSEVEVVKMPKFDETSFADYPKNLDDDDILKLKMFLREKKFDAAKDTILDAVKSHALMHSYNPVIDYLKSVEWDGEDRVSKFFHRYMGAEDTDYNSYIGKMMLTAACARVDKPGCKFDYIIIIEGKQGIGKSQAIQALGSPWFKEISLTDRDKDTIQKMQGSWIIEVPEMTCFKKQELESLKAFITTQVDHTRFAYGRTDRKYARQSIFIGTLNPDTIGYLTDRTGNRRFLPVRANSINIASLRAEKHQLWAQAWQIYKDGFPLYITDEHIHKQAVVQQRSRQITDDWCDEIADWIDNNINKDATALEIYTEAIGGSKEGYTTYIARRIATAMSTLGYTKTRYRNKGELREKAYILETSNKKIPWEE